MITVVTKKIPHFSKSFTSSFFMFFSGILLNIDTSVKLSYDEQCPKLVTVVVLDETRHKIAHKN